MAWHQMFLRCSSCNKAMGISTIWVNSQAQIQAIFHCKPCNINIPQYYNILKLREWAEGRDAGDKTLLQSNLEKVNDGNFLKGMKIVPDLEVK